ncbi:hypothetical protein K9U40_20270 [Xanthobacter autotrophicus]|uniref:hypothetical protein n=1 Tax=Xanthobacter autotrophicus TaxID=280 RepID=UPI0024AA0B42|nr:hypothetical protein [Xanthobacter autotrophicus]MDI4666637.1 hypothetical protein [Xanthobacter autotrophicus]
MDGLNRRVAALKDEIDALQSALWPRQGSFDRLASEAQDWISERAESLPRISLPEVRRKVSKHLPASSRSLAVVAAALVVGAGVGCVLYALTSGQKGRPAGTGARDGVRRPASKVAE